MKIISHRGYWKNEIEKNSEVAFKHSFALGLGTETDIRDFNQELVISHDIGNSASMKLDRFFTLYNNYPKQYPLALNIKADGLQNKLKMLIEQFSVSDYFVFDMSVPDTLGYVNNGIRFFSRQSEYELNPIFYDKCAGIWLDAFIDNWYNAEVIFDHIKNKKHVAIVSPELHRREEKKFWEFLKNNRIHSIDEVILCTDKPEDAINYFEIT